MKKKYLAMDFGASTGRGILGSFDGEKLVMDEVHRFSNYFVPVNGKFYWDIFRLYHETENSVQKAVLQGNNMVSVGVDTWGTDYGLLGTDGQLLGNCRCMRNADSTYQDLVEQEVSLKEIFSRTGIQAIYGNTIFQLFERKYCKDPAIKEASDMLMLPDLLGYFLTGEKANEYTMATTSMMYNQNIRDWDRELMGRIGLPKDICNRILLPGTEKFAVQKPVLENIGIEELKYVPVATHDTASAVVAAPLKKHEAFCSSGTWSLLGVEVPKAVLTEDAFKAGFSNEGTADGGIRLLKNIMGMWILQQMMQQWQRTEPNLSWNEIVERAEKVESFRSFIDVEQPEFYQTGHMTEKVQNYCSRTGQPVPETVGELARCVYESLAMRYRITVEALEKIVGYRIETLRIVGGGCQNRILNQFAANALQRLVYTGPVECACAGNILVQAMADGEVGSYSEIREIIEKSFAMGTYEPVETEKWNQGFEKYLHILEG